MVSLIFTCAGVINGAAARGRGERGVTSPSAQPANIQTLLRRPGVFPSEGSSVIPGRGGDSEISLLYTQRPQ